MFYSQGGTAKDQDLHVNVSKELRSHFVRKKLPSMNSAGVRLVAVSITIRVYTVIIWGFEGLPSKVREIDTDLEKPLQII